MFERGIAVIGLGYIGLPTGRHRHAGRACHGSRREPGRRSRRSTAAGALRGARSRRRRRGCRTRGQAPARAPSARGRRLRHRRSHARSRTSTTADLSYVERPRRRSPRCCAAASSSSSSRPPRPARPSRSASGLPSDGPTSACRMARRAPVHVAHCPERVLPGRIMIELVDNDRVVGGITPEAAPSGPRELYRVFCQGEIVLHRRARPPRWPSWSRTPSATSTSPSPTSCRCSPSARARRVGAHPARQPPPAREHPAARARASAATASRSTRGSSSRAAPDQPR